MTVTRRQFIRAAAGAAALPLIASPALARRRELAPFTYLDWSGIARGPQRLPGATGHASGMMVASGEGGNALVVANGDHAVLIDCKNAPFGELLKREAAIAPYSSGKGEISLVINTHHHADHTGGNWAFTKDHTVLAHAKVPDRVRTQLARYTRGAAEAADGAADDNPKSKVVKPFLERFAERAPTLSAEDFAPNETLATDHPTREVGEITIQLHHFGAGHTDNDVAVYFPNENVLHTGDLLFHNLHPYCDATGGCDTAGWQRSLFELIRLTNDDTIVVPGHGAVTDTGALRAQRAYFDRVRELVLDAKAQGKSRDEVIKLAAPQEYAAYGHAQFWPIVLGFVFDEAE